jgi:ADP-ribose pyrophosphatase
MISYTHPDVLGTGVTAGWADPQTDPTRIDDWPARQRAAEIWFDVVDGRPVNPYAPTGIQRGRNQLGHWGEARAADAIVTATTDDGRVILLVERSDGHGWAIPGGHVEPGEDAPDAAVRELAEETGLRLPADLERHVMRTRYVNDPRASDEAWMVTTPVLVELGHREPLPAVAGADDADSAEWWPAGSYAELVCELQRCYPGHRIFPAHQALLAEVLDGPGEDELAVQEYFDNELADCDPGELRHLAEGYLRLVSAIEMTMANVSDWKPDDGLSEVEQLTSYLEHLTEATHGACDLCGRAIYAPHQITDLPDRPFWHPRRLAGALTDFCNGLRYGGYRIAHRDCADRRHPWAGLRTR